MFVKTKVEIIFSLRTLIMAENLSPFVYWGQNRSQITLKIELRDASVRYIETTFSYCL